MKVPQELLPELISFLESTYGEKVIKHEEMKGEEVARGMVDGKFIAIDKRGELLTIICSDKKFLEEELSPLFGKYISLLYGEQE